VIAQRQLLDLDGMDRTDVEALIARAGELKKGVAGADRALVGRIVLGMFFEPSTRTVISFAVATHRLGGLWLNFDAAGSSLEKGESLEDTMRTVKATGVDAVVVRHPESGYPHALARHFGGCVINAGDGSHAHPTQGILDAMTLLEEFGDLSCRHVIIVGDVVHSRVARSTTRALSLLGAQVTLCAPPMLLPSGDPIWGTARRAHDLDACLPSADAVMLLRIQKERAAASELPPPSDLAGEYGLTESRAEKLPKHCIVMHPGPVNRGVEIAHSIVAGSRSRIDRQVENGVFVRMAVLEWGLGR